MTYIRYIILYLITLLYLIPYVAYLCNHPYLSYLSQSLLKGRCDVIVLSDRLCNHHVMNLV